jgi:hypothetical protein
MDVYTDPTPLDVSGAVAALPEPIGIDADPGSPVPGMEAEADAPGPHLQGFLVPDPDSGLARFRLAEPGEYPALVLAGGDQAGRQYESEITILEGRRPVERTVIGMNEPARYRGHCIYQYSYDRSGRRYTVLRVASASGLPLVWAGYLLLGAGVCWLYTCAAP